MDLVYISEVECDEQEYVPNFTIPGGKDIPHEKDYIKAATTATAASVGTIAGTMAIGTLSAFTPISLLVGASVAIPAIYKLVVSEDKAEPVPAESFNELQGFINKHSLGKQQAINRGFRFPPGHPQVGETYRLHPLANQNTSKQNLYIPEHIFEDVLFEERESELLTLLVNLGATNVEIAKYVDNLFDGEKLGSLSGGVREVAEASISAKSCTGSEYSEKNTRSFSLKGKPWSYGDKLDIGRYAWLNFEPSWNALIMAREVGGCTSATLEIKEASKYTANKEASLQLKAKIYSANGTLKLMEKDLKETTYIVKVEFSEAVTT